MTKIIQAPHPILRQPATAVPREQIESATIKNLIKKMSLALTKEPDGVAIAAPQVGAGWRIFVVSGRLTAENPATPGPDLVFINPVITNSSRRQITMDEGCLSVRWRYGQVKRAQKVTLEAYNEHGRKVVRHATGLWAQIFQHEIDHLNGVLFIDKAREIVEIKPDHAN